MYTELSYLDLFVHSDSGYTVTRDNKRFDVK